MFIRSVYKKNRGSGQVYSYQQLIESVRTPRGPRQRILLNLGTLEIPAAEWKELANRIEALYLGQQELYPAAPHLESLAQQYADLLRQQEFSRAAVAVEAAQWETVVIDAGIASAANLAAIQAAGFSYIAVSRSRPQEMPASGMVVIKETNATTIQVQRLNQDGEVIPGYPAQISENQTTAGLTTNVVTINFLQST